MTIDEFRDWIDYFAIINGVKGSEEKKSENDNNVTGFMQHLKGM